MTRRPRLIVTESLLLVAFLAGGSSALVTSLPSMAISAPLPLGTAISPSPSRGDPDQDRTADSPSASNERQTSDLTEESPRIPDSEQEPKREAPDRVLVRNENGELVIARLHGKGKETVVLLPDGRLAWTRGELAYTDEAFVPSTADEIVASLTRGPFRTFRALITERYVVLYERSEDFAKASSRLLESLYAGLIAEMRGQGFPVHDADFPLVAIIFRDEEAFRAHQSVPEDVQAYYDVLSNRIVLYESSLRDEQAPDVAARKRPQTVAHEGTHQILQNIGVQPRLAPWPQWVIEGLAEYYAPTMVGRDGSWKGSNRVNPFHMATLRDLKDPLSFQLELQGITPPRLGRPPGMSTVQYLVTLQELNPTDYALAWALVHFLMNKRSEQFLSYLKELGERPVLTKASPQEHLDHFRQFFPQPPAQMDREIDRYLAGLKGYETLSYYAVTFEQPIGQGLVRRASMVSQSPAMIRQWIDSMRAMEGGPVVWNAYRFPTRTRARLAAEQWIQSP